MYKIKDVQRCAAQQQQRASELAIEKDEKDVRKRSIHVPICSTSRVRKQKAKDRKDREKSYVQKDVRKIHRKELYVQIYQHHVPTPRRSFTISVPRLAVQQAGTAGKNVKMYAWKEGKR